MKIKDLHHLPYTEGPTFWAGVVRSPTALLKNDAHLRQFLSSRGPCDSVHVQRSHLPICTCHCRPACSPSPVGQGTDLPFLLPNAACSSPSFPGPYRKVPEPPSPLSTPVSHPPVERRRPLPSAIGFRVLRVRGFGKSPTRKATLVWNYKAFIVKVFRPKTYKLEYLHSCNSVMSHTSRKVCLSGILRQEICFFQVLFSSPCPLAVIGRFRQLLPKSNKSTWLKTFSEN